jgi:hypothetical protein
MTYHFPRYLHWFENKNLEYFYTSNPRQNWSPILPDLLFAQFFALFSNDRFIFIPILLSVLVSSYYVYQITFLISSDKNISFLAGLIALIIPSQIAFASSSQTDPITTALVIILLYYSVLLKEKKTNSLFYLMLLMFPLFLTVKTTGFILSIPIYLYVIMTYRRIIFNNVAKYIGVLSLAILPALPYVYRVWKFGRDAGSGVFVSDFSFSGVIVNTWRIFLNNLQTPIAGLNVQIERFFYSGADLIGIKSNPKGYGSYGDFYLTTSLHGDLTGNPLHVILLIVASIGLIFAGRYRFLVTLVLVQFLFLGAFIGWQPWINRFSSTILVISSILIGIWLSDRSKALRRSLIIVLMLYSSFWVFFNPSRSLLDPKPLLSLAERFGMTSRDLVKIRHDLVFSRDQQYFSARPELEQSYISAIEKVKTSGVRDLYIKIGGDDFEYPIWVLTDFKISIKHYKDENLRQIQSGDMYLFCTVECSQYKLKPIFVDQYVSLWR